MKMSEAFPSKYLKAADLAGRAHKLVIDGADYAELGDGTAKPALTFIGKQKQLILNKTNGSLLAAAFGDDADKWRGKEIEIYPDKASMQGRIVDCIRVRVPAPPAATGGTGLPEDDIPW